MYKRIGETIFIPTGIFFLGLILRTMVSGTYLVGDEITWINRGQTILSLLINLDFTAEKWAISTHPGLTVSIPIGVSISLLKWIPVYIAARIPQIILGAMTPPLLFFYCKEFTSKKVAVIASLLLAFEPIHIGLSSIAHVDSTLTFFFLLTTYTFLRGLKDVRWMIFSGVSLSLALLTKSSGILLLLTNIIPLIIIYAISRRSHRLGLKHVMISVLLWPAIGLVLFYIGWPFLWSENIFQALFNYFFPWVERMPSLSAGRANFFLGSVTSDPPAYYYLFLLPVHLSPLIIFGLIFYAFKFISQIAKTPVEKHIVTFPLLSLHLSITIPLMVFSLASYKGFRFLSPAFPFITAISALGLGWLGDQIVNHFRLKNPAWLKVNSFRISVALIILLSLQYLSVYPYMGAYEYVSPLVGSRAEHIVVMGWGREMGIAADFLNQLQDKHVIAVFGYIDHFTYYSRHPSFLATSLNVKDVCEKADYIVFQLSYVQRYCLPGSSGYELWSYFSNKNPIYTVEMYGMTFAWVFEC